MRIVLVHKRYDLSGGAEWDVRELSRRLAARGHEVYVLTGEAKIAPPPGVTIRRVPVVRAGKVAKLVTFALYAPRFWRALEPDVTIGFGNTVGEHLYRCSGGLHSVYLGLVAGCGTALRRMRNRLSPAQWVTLAIERAKFKGQGHRRVLAVSELTRAEILQTYPFWADRVEVVHYGVDRTRFRPGNRAALGAGTREELGLRSDDPVVLFVGSGFRRKGVDVLLEVWRKGAPRGAALVIAGADARLSWLAGLARRGKFGKVVFTGAVPWVERLYATADLFVLPSLWEGCPVVMLEALASGVPVVVPARTGAPELLAGALRELLLEDQRDPGEVRAKIETGLDPARRARLCREAEEVAGTLDIERATDAVERWCLWAGGR